MIRETMHWTLDVSMEIEQTFDFVLLEKPAKRIRNVLKATIVTQTLLEENKN